MRKRGLDFGRVSRLEPDAVGQPGARRFRLLAWSADSTACLWMEKEQLQALGIAIDQMLAPLAVLWSQSEPPATPSQSVDAPVSFDVEVEVGKLGLSYDERQEYFTLLVHDSESVDEETPSFALSASREQLQGLSRRITALAAAGRPRCPLCGRPIEESEPHVCSGSNGHTTH